MTRTMSHLTTALEHLDLVEPGSLERRDKVKLTTALWLLDTIKAHQEGEMYARPRVPRSALRVVRRRR